jgi:hypothetical protein
LEESPLRLSKSKKILRKISQKKSLNAGEENPEGMTGNGETGIMIEMKGPGERKDQGEIDKIEKTGQTEGHVKIEDHAKTDKTEGPDKTEDHHVKIDKTEGHVKIEKIEDLGNRESLERTENRENPERTENRENLERTENRENQEKIENRENQERNGSPEKIKNKENHVRIGHKEETSTIRTEEITEITETTGEETDRIDLEEEISKGKEDLPLPGLKSEPLSLQRTILTLLLKYIPYD